MGRKLLQVIVLICFGLCIESKSWLWSSLSNKRESKEISSVPKLRKHDGISYLKGSLESLPDGFYRGEIQEQTACMQAYVEMSQHCGAGSESKRMHLATLLTNCHLEAINREMVYWHPQDKLKYADEAEVSLVMQYVPLLGSICEKTGNSYGLALFRMQFETDMKLWANIEELHYTVEEARKVNEETMRLTNKLELLTAQSFTWSNEIRDVSADLKGATDALTTEYLELEEIGEKINASVLALSTENEDFTNTLLRFFNETNEQVELLGDTVKLQKKYEELSESFRTLQEEYLACTRRADSFQDSFIFQVSRQLPRIEFFASLLKTLKTTVWVDTALSIASTVKKWVLIPIDIVKRLQVLKSSFWVNKQVQVLIDVVQVPLCVLYIICLYRAVMFGAALLQVWNPVRAIFIWCVSLLRNTLCVLLYPSKLFYELLSEESQGSHQSLSGTLWQGRRYPFQELSTPGPILGERITASTRGAVLHPPCLERIEHALDGLERRIATQILDKLCRVERRQIHIFRAFQATRKEFLGK